MTPGLRKWLAIGSGIGIEIRAEDLRVTLARLRPSGAQLLGATTIARFRERHATEWGAEYAEFLKDHGAGHLAATVLLPRREVIVRQLTLAGVASRDLGAAIEFQLDALHPYREGEAVWAWARFGDSASVLLGISRRSAIEHYMALFAEAGVKVSSFTFSTAVLYSAIRLLADAPGDGFLALCDGEGGLEAYGESAARAVFSATLEAPRDKAAELACAELRLPQGTQPVQIASLLPLKAGAWDSDLSRDALACAAALAGASPRPALSVNLLPAEQRSSSSRAMFIPTAGLALALLIILGALALISPLEDRQYRAALAAEIARLEPQARQSAALDRTIETTRARARLLDDFRRRTKADLDAMNELTGLLAPPTWLNGLELTRSSVALSGEAEQAAPLLKLIDGSPMFQNSEFTIPLGRSGKNELFRIRTAREGVLP